MIIWDTKDPKTIQTRKVSLAHNESSFYRNAIKQRSPETIANIAITLIHQTDYLLYKYIEYVKKDFLANGGIREQMTRARLQARGQQPNKPNEPNKPYKPNEPNNPNKPNNPNEPNKPYKPNNPNEPNEPNKPNNPNEPNEPNKPNNPN